MAQDQRPSSSAPQGRHGAGGGPKPAAKRFRQGAAPTKGTSAPRHAAHAAHGASGSVDGDGGHGRHGRGTGHVGSHRVAPATSGTPRVRSARQEGAVASSDAPRPIDVDPSETGAFQTLGSGQGAVLHDRTNSAEAADAARSNLGGHAGRLAKGHRPRVRDRSTRAHVSRKAIIGLCVAAAVVIVAIVVVVMMLLDSPSTSAEGTAAPRIEQTQAEVGKGVLYDGYVYDTTQQADGTYALTRTPQGSADGSDALVLFQLEGTPVTVVLYNGAFLIPENIGDDQWKVMAYTLGDGSMASELQDGNGQAVEGTGTIASASLDGSTLSLTFEDGSTQTISAE